MKRWKKILLILLSIVMVLLAGGCLYLFNSPMPGVFLLRYAFGGETALQMPQNYEEKKANVEISKDLTYPSKEERNQFDLYLPKERKEALPVIVWVHGGAFVAGDKSGIENWAVMLANEGYAVAALNYQWAPEIQYPGQVKQIQEGIKELQKMEEEGIPIDMSNVILAGDSAGAHIAAQAGLLATNEDYEKELAVESALEKEDVKAMLLYCGPYNVEQILKVDDTFMQFLASRIGWAMFGDKHWKEGTAIQTTTIKNYVTDDFPPSYIADGNSGSFEKEGKELVETLKNKNVFVESLFFDKGEGEIPHEYQFDLTTSQGERTYKESIEFLKEVFK